MTDLNNSDYFAARARDERSLSNAATDTRSAAAHLELAERYEALAIEFALRGPTYHGLSSSLGDGLTPDRSMRRNTGAAPVRFPPSGHSTDGYDCAVREEVETSVEARRSGR